eukprot:Rmarinus@m.27070
MQWRYCVLFDQMLVIGTPHVPVDSPLTEVIIEHVLMLDDVVVDSGPLFWVRSPDSDQQFGFDTLSCENFAVQTFKNTESKLLFVQDLLWAILITRKGGYDANPVRDCGELAERFSVVVANGDVDETRHMLHPSPEDEDSGLIADVVNCRALSYNMAPLHIAVCNGDVEMVAVLLLHGAKPEVISKEGENALHLACSHQSVEVLQRLVDCVDVDVNFPDTSGRPPLQIAIESADESLAKIDVLLTAGASVSVCSRAKQTPLHVAASIGSTHACEILLRHGAVPNVRDLNLDTPMHVAKSSDVLDVLIRHGGRPTLRNSAGETVVDSFVSRAEKRKDTDDTCYANRVRSFVQQRITGAIYCFENLHSLDYVAELSSLPPGQWTEDGESCELCYTEFNLFVGRHHCRSCGMLVCDDCSTKRAIIDETSERICDGCFLILFGEGCVRF